MRCCIMETTQKRISPLWRDWKSVLKIFWEPSVETCREAPTHFKTGASCHKAERAFCCDVHIVRVQTRQLSPKGRRRCHCQTNFRISRAWNRTVILWRDDNHLVTTFSHQFTAFRQRSHNAIYLRMPGVCDDDQFLHRLPFTALRAARGSLIILLPVLPSCTTGSDGR